MMQRLFSFVPRWPMAILFLTCFAFGAQAQYPPQAGMAGSTAVPRTSPLFTGWADQAQLERGWIHIADKGMGKVSSGTVDLALGEPDFQVVSLGDSGVITLYFDAPIYNGPGFDFAVFENGFKHPQDPSLAFLEFAFVEVSDNGQDFYRFPSAYQGDDQVQIAGAGMFQDASMVHNLAGKYVGGFGTPFDLEDLSHYSGLDIDHITHIRLVDVIGSIGPLGSKDELGRIINDPYPTDFPVGGFDLDAVGAFYQHGRYPTRVSSDIRKLGKPYRLYPNPVHHELYLDWDQEEEVYLSLVDPLGRMYKDLPWEKLGPGRLRLDLRSWGPGLYLLQIQTKSGQQWTEKLYHYSLP